jgi:hypothetical protein
MLYCFTNAGLLSSYYIINFSQARVLEKTNWRYIPPQSPQEVAVHTEHEFVMRKIKIT